MFIKNSTNATVVLRGITLPPETAAEFPDSLRKDNIFMDFVTQNQLREVESLGEPYTPPTKRKTRKVTK